MYQNILKEGTAYVLHPQICIFMSPHILIYTTVATYFEQCYSNNHAGSQNDKIHINLVKPKTYFMYHQL